MISASFSSMVASCRRQVSRTSGVNGVQSWISSTTIIGATVRNERVGLPGNFVTV